MYTEGYNKKVSKEEFKFLLNFLKWWKHNKVDGKSIDYIKEKIKFAKQPEWKQLLLDEYFSGLSESRGFADSKK